MSRFPVAAAFLLFAAVAAPSTPAQASTVISGQIGGDSKISFKNVFKPGLQFHWNIPKSPFYLGVGAHYGPQFLDTAAGDEMSVRSFRFSFLNFGLDIPIKTFYWSMN